MAYNDKYTRYQSTVLKVQLHMDTKSAVTIYTSLL